MKCQFCSGPATVHLTKIEGGQKNEMHLCQACAEQQQLTPPQGLNLPAILHTLIGQHVGAHSDELARLTCPACGIKYMEFRAQGRLGCPHDYHVFRTGLEPLLERIHRGTRHRGKSPRHRSSPAHTADLLDLRRRLQAAVDAERYEDAAQLRNLLRKKEAADEPG